MLLSMRISLKSDKAFFETVKTLIQILKNIVKDPSNMKYQRLRLSNEKIKQCLTNNEQSLFFLEMLGFEK